MSDPAAIPHAMPAGVAPSPCLPMHSPPHEVVCLLPDDCALSDAIDALLHGGFAGCRIGLLARAGDVGALGLALSLDALMEAAPVRHGGGFHPVLDRGPVRAMGGEDARAGGASGHVRMLGVLWAAAVTGGIIAATGVLAAEPGPAAAAWGLCRSHADHLRHQGAAGGLLLWVHAPDPGLERQAARILVAHGGRNVCALDADEVAA